MGVDKSRRPWLGPAERYSKVQSCSSAGATVGSRGNFVLVSTSTVATTPTVFYLAQPQIGDAVSVFCTTVSSSAGAVLRASSSAMLFNSTGQAFDSIEFFFPASIYLVALSTSLWGVQGASTAASVGAPLLIASSS